MDMMQKIIYISINIITSFWKIASLSFHFLATFNVFWSRSWRIVGSDHSKNNNHKQKSKKLVQKFLALRAKFQKKWWFLKTWIHRRGGKAHWLDGSNRPNVNNFRLIYLEVGSRGIFSIDNTKRLRDLCKITGDINRKRLRGLKFQIEKIAIRASHNIFKNRNNAEWTAPAFIYEPLYELMYNVPFQ